MGALRKALLNLGDVWGLLLYELGGVLAQIFPVSVGYFLSVAIAEVNFQLNARSRRAVLANLRHVHGGALSEAELRRIAKRTFRNFAKFIVDFLRLPRVTKKSIARQIAVEALEIVKKEYGKEKGVIFLGAHLGNWELGGTMFALCDVPLSVVAMRHKNELIDRFFVKRRTRKGIRPVSVGVATSELLGSLRRGECVGILGDRNLLGRGLKWQFFGAPAMLPYSHVVLSLRTGAPIILGFVIREKGDRFKLFVEEPIRPQGCFSSFAELMQRCVGLIEKYVRQYPDQWFVFEPIWRDAE
ncbi:MAG: lysophospholipid acyltransferase family protein [Candidatus Eisenbacteria bacterium]